MMQQSVLWNQQRFKHHLLKKLGEKLHKNLQEEMPKRYDTVICAVQQQFGKVADELTKRLQAQIDQNAAQYDDMIQQCSEAIFSMQKERERLDEIYEQLIDLYNMAGKALGRSSQELSHLLSPVLY